MGLRALTVAVLLCLSTTAFAQGQFIDIGPKNLQEIQLVLDTLDDSVMSSQPDLPTIVMMLHGDEAHHFLRRNYEDNKSLIDQTAKLAAYRIIEVQICATWMRMNGYESGELFPFVSTVPFGAGEIERLVTDEGYVEFSVDL